MAGENNGANMGSNAAKAASKESKKKRNENGGFPAWKGISRTLFINGIALLLIFSVVILPILFLFALPTMMFEAVMSFVEKLKNDLKQVSYEREAGVNFLTALKNATKIIWSDTFGSLWNTFKGWLTSINDRSYNKIDTDGISDDATEIRITQEEAAQKATLMDCLYATKDSYQQRAEEIEEELSSGSVYATISGYAASLYQSEYGSFPQWNESSGSHGFFDPYPTYEDAVADTEKTYFQYGGVTINVNIAKMTDMDAARIMCICTVMKGASLSDMHLSDYQKWLGYNPQYVFFWPWSKAARNSKMPIDIGLGASNPKVDKWIGTCLPQYLQDQVKYEIDNFGKPTSNGYPDQACSAMELCMTVNATDVNQIPSATREFTTEETRYFKAFFDADGNRLDSETGQPVPVSLRSDEGIVVQPLKVVIGDNNLGGGGSTHTPPPAVTPAGPSPTPAPQEKKTSETFTYNVCNVTYNFSVTIGTRDPEKVLDYLGFIGTEGAMDVQPAGGHTSLFSQPAVGDTPATTTPEPTVSPEPTFNPDDLPEEVGPNIPYDPETGDFILPSPSPSPGSDLAA